MEKALAAAWAESLSRESNKISINDKFIGLGRDSLSAMRLVSIAQRNKIELTVSMIFQNATLVELAQAANQITSSREELIRPFELLPAMFTREFALLEAQRQCKVPRDLIEDISPATSLQEAMFKQSLSGHLTQFAQEAVELNPKIDLVANKASWGFVVQMFPIVRTRLILAPGRVFQVVVDKQFVWYEIDDCEDYMVTDQQRKSGPGDALARFALYEDPLLKRRVFILSMHHSLFDSITLGLIFDAVYRTYYHIKIPPSPSFNKFIQQAERTRHDLSSLNFWRTYLAGSQPQQYPSLPSPLYTPQSQSSSQHLIPFSRASSSTITTSTSIRAAYALLLYQETQSTDILFSAFLAGRNVSLPGIESFAAPTFTQVPIRIVIDLSISIQAFLERTQDDGVHMIPYKHVGLPNIAKLSDDAATACNVRNLLVVQPFPSDGATFPPGHDASHKGGDAFPGTILSGPRVDASAMGAFNPYALLVECTLMDIGVFVRTSFDEDVLSGERMGTLMAAFKRVLGGLIGCEGTGREKWDPVGKLL